VQWVLSLIAIYSTPVDAAAPGGDWLSRLGTWWLTWGLGAFWWPGFIVSIATIAALVASRRAQPDAAAGAEPGAERVRTPTVAVVDRDRINRAGLLLMIGLGVVGAAIVLALPALAHWAPWLPQPAITALALDGGFLAVRAPWVLALWAASLATAVAVLVAGRWTRTTRLVSVVSSVLWAGLLLWWILGGAILVSPFGDSVAKACLGALVLLIGIDAVITARRTSRPFPVPAV
jgi:hypothetical protein